MGHQRSDSWAMETRKDLESVQLHHITGQDDRIQSFGSATTAYASWPMLDQTLASSSNESHRQSTPQGRAIFVPDFWPLRRKCLHSAERELRALERDIETIKDPGKQEAALKRAATLLQSLDTQLTNQYYLLQFCDPQFAADRGLSVVQFEVGEGHDIAGNWTMIADRVGKEARSTYDNIQTNHRKLHNLHQQQVERFVGESIDSLNNIYVKRSKTIVERQPWVFVDKPNDYIPRARPAVKFWWKVAFTFACIAWIMFFGVGVLATNSTFAPIFIRTFYWIAVVWTLVPTILLTWMVKAWGGTAGDMLMAALASLGLWLVMIQIGQTHLATQLRGQRIPP